MATFKRHNEEWCVACETMQAHGTEIEVTKRFGGSRRVRIGELVTTTINPTTYVYAILKGKGNDDMRTPSMTSHEAETAIGTASHVGALLETNVDARIRGILRKWYSAKGIASAFNCRLSVSVLVSGYNYTASFDAIKAAYVRGDDPASLNSDGKPAPADDDDESDVRSDDESPDDDESERRTETNAAIETGKVTLPAQPKANDPLQTIRDILGVSAVNADQVNAIINARLKGVREELLGLAPRRIEVSTNGAPAIKLEGQHPVFERVCKLVADGQNVLLIGPAGTGKTYLSEQLAKALNRTYGHISGSSGVSESALTGWRLPFEGGVWKYVPAQFIKLYEEGNSLFCFDEFDSFDPNMLMTAQTATSNGHVSVPHRYENPTVKRGQNVSIIATANTYGTGANPIYSARNALDGATLDRYIIVDMDYDRDFESKLAAASGLSGSELSEIWSLRDKVQEAGLRRVVSTRAIQKAAAMKRIGDDWRTVMATLVAGWSRDEKQRAGVAY